MKRRFLALAFLFMSSLSHAQLAVFDASAFGQLVTEVTLLQQQLDETTKSLAALKSLGSFQWANEDMLNLMNELNSTMNQYSRISYNAANLDTQFKQLYPGYQSPTNYQEQYQENATETLNTINGTLKTIGMNTSDFSTESSRLGALHTHVQTAQGQTQAIQAMSEISEELVTQTQSLRQMVAAQTNSEAAYFSQQVQKEASGEAELQEVLSKGMTEAPAYASDPDECF